MSEFESAVRKFTEAWGSLATSLIGDYTCYMTCSEAEALATLFKVAGDEPTAIEIIANHARTDEPGDDHFGEEAGL